MSEIRATDLVRPSIAAEGPDSFEIRSANLPKANVVQLALPYEIRSANLVKGNLGKAEVGS